MARAIEPLPCAPKGDKHWHKPSFQISLVLSLQFLLHIITQTHTAKSSWVPSHRLWLSFASTIWQCQAFFSLPGQKDETCSWWWEKPIKSPTQRWQNVSMMPVTFRLTGLMVWTPGKQEEWASKEGKFHRKEMENRVQSSHCRGESSGKVPAMYRTQ